MILLKRTFTNITIGSNSGLESLYNLIDLRICDLDRTIFSFVSVENLANITVLTRRYHLLETNIPANTHQIEHAQTLIRYEKSELFHHQLLQRVTAVTFLRTV